MITLEQAITSNEFHLPKGDGTCYRYRRNGKTKTWKRTPGRYRVPVKNGLYNYGHISAPGYQHPNLHTLEDCATDSRIK
jgi:hypothetical protein